MAPNYRRGPDCRPEIEAALLIAARLQSCGILGSFRKLTTPPNNPPVLDDAIKDREGCY